MPRTALWFALAFAPSVVSAQPVQSLARIKAGSANLYSGPGEQMPRCGALEQGTVIVVDHPEGNDWLAIQPPVGSLSWINHSHVQLQSAPTADAASVTRAVNAVVNNAGVVKLAVGQMGVAKPLNVQRTNIPDGTIVKIIGPKVRATAEGDTTESFWYPIVPPRDDFRFVRRADVELIGGTEKGGFVVKAAARPGEGEAPVAPFPGSDVKPAGGSTAGTDGANGPQWQAAEKARLDGNYAQAERLYKLIAEEATKAGDTALANLCFNRIHSIREMQRGRDRGDPARPISADPPAVAQKPQAGALSGSGLLRVVDFKFENRQVYALTDKRGVSLYLVSDDLDLSRYNRRWVELNGPVTYPKAFGGTGLMTVTAVEKVEEK